MKPTIDVEDGNLHTSHVLEIICYSEKATGGRKDRVWLKLNPNTDNEEYFPLRGKGVCTREEAVLKFAEWLGVAVVKEEEQQPSYISDEKAIVDLGDI